MLNFVALIDLIPPKPKDDPDPGVWLAAGACFFVAMVLAALAAFYATQIMAGLKREIMLQRAGLASNERLLEQYRELHRSLAKAIATGGQKDALASAYLADFEKRQADKPS